MIELIVVISVSVLMVSSVAVSLNNYYGREKVSQGATRLVSLLDLARTYAVTNQSPAGFSGLDYVSVTLTANGKLSAYPVNNISGSGPSYFSEKIASSPIISTVLVFGNLNFAAGSGKLVGVQSPGFNSYPLASDYSVGVTLTSSEISPDSHQVVILPFGGITNNFSDL